MAGGRGHPLPRVMASALGLIAVAALLTAAVHLAAGRRDPQSRPSPVLSATPAATVVAAFIRHQLPGVWPASVPGTARLAAPLLACALPSLVIVWRPVPRLAGHTDRGPPVALSTL